MISCLLQLIAWSQKLFVWVVIQKMCDGKMEMMMTIFPINKIFHHISRSFCPLILPCLVLLWSMTIGHARMSDGSRKVIIDSGITFHLHILDTLVRLRLSVRTVNLFYFIFLKRERIFCCLWKDRIRVCVFHHCCPPREIVNIVYVCVYAIQSTHLIIDQCTCKEF